MERYAVVWAWQRLPELKNELGLVACPIELAERLMAEGLVQDPRLDVAGLRPIDDLFEARGNYTTRELLARRPKHLHKRQL